MSQYKPWAAFLFVGLFAWGTSFLWIKIGVAEIGPFTLVALRITFAVISAWVYIRLAGIKLPRDSRPWIVMAVLGLLNICIPFTLISWGETRIDSVLAGLINSTVPLFTVVLAHFFVNDDRITFLKIFGVLVGFGGVAVLVGRDIRVQGVSGDILGQIAVLVSSLAYAVSGVTIRKYLREVHPIVITAGAATAALVVMWILAPVIEAPFHLPREPLTWVAIVWLGTIGTTSAYLAYFYLIGTWGPTRASTVTYVIPIVAVVLGVVFLGEEIGWQLIVGGLGIIAGILILNWHNLHSLLSQATR